MVASTVKNGNDRNEREIGIGVIHLPLVNDYGVESDAKTKNL